MLSVPCWQCSTIPNEKTCVTRPAGFFLNLLTVFGSRNTNTDDLLAHCQLLGFLSRLVGARGWAAITVMRPYAAHSARRPHFNIALSVLYLQQLYGCILPGPCCTILFRYVILLGVRFNSILRPDVAFCALRRCDTVACLEFPPCCHGYMLKQWVDAVWAAMRAASHGKPKSQTPARH